jgi:hypothetical protein
MNPPDAAQARAIMDRITASSYSMLAKDGQPDHRVPIELDR